MTVAVALADTSVFIALEAGRVTDASALPDRLLVSTISIGELRAGVLIAVDVDTRRARLRTLDAALRRAPLPVDELVAEAWAHLRARLREAGRRMPVNDSWIAATALAHDVPVITQDDDYDVVDQLEVIKL